MMLYSVQQGQVMFLLRKFVTFVGGGVKERWASSYIKSRSVFYPCKG
jgi:hypothetical protein